MGAFQNTGFVYSLSPKCTIVFLWMLYYYPAITVADLSPVTNSKELPIVSMEMETATIKGFHSATHDFKLGLRNVTGQPLALKMLITSLIAQSAIKDCKPLVLYLAGGTGTGKTRAAQILKELWPSSSFTNSSSHYFSEHDDNEVPVKQHNSRVSSNCPFPEGLHIFDNSDRYSSTFVWSIIQTLRLKPVTGATKCDCSGSAFIFIGNHGKNEILKTVQDAHSSGVPRKDIGEVAFKKLSNSLISKPDCSIPSELIRLNLIDHVIPFLPMERQQVSSCATAIARDLGMPKAIIRSEAEKIADQLPFDSGYSVMGCGRVYALLKYRMTEILLEKNQYSFGEEFSTDSSNAEEGDHEPDNQRESKTTINQFHYYLIKNLYINITISFAIDFIIRQSVYYFCRTMRRYSSNLDLET